MTLPVLEKTWQFDVNNTTAAQGTAIATQKLLIRSFKNALISFASNPWVVHYSCDGAAAGSDGDGVDRWADDGDIVFASADATGARSWTVLRNADGVELLIECRGNTSAGHTARVVMSPAAGFTGGTTTARPTATDEAILVDGSGTNSTCWGAGGYSNTTDRGIAWHVWHSSDGLVTIAAFCFNTAATGLWYIGRVSQPLSGWTKPVVGIIVCDTATTPIAGPDYAHLLEGTDTDAGNPRRMGCFPSGNAQIYCTSESCGTGSAGSTTPVGQLVASVNEISSVYELPSIGICCQVTNFRGMGHARLFDVKWCSTALNTADTAPGDASRTRAVFGNVLLPWNGSVVTTSA